MGHTKRTRPVGDSKRELPRLGTVPCREYFLTYAQITSFYHFVLHTVGHIDRAAEVAHKALVDVEVDEAKKKAMQEEWKARKGAVDALKKQRQFLLEILLVRHVESYLNYLAGLLFEIFTQRPETLRSSDRVAVEEVLRQPTVDAIVRYVAERKVESLSYSSFEDLAAFFLERFSLELVAKPDLPTVIHAIETRNISVHNRCIVNRRFLARTRDESTPPGKLLPLYVQYLDRIVPLLAKSVRSLDVRARKRLRLKAVRFDVRALGGLTTS